uniref:MSP domain-containing protein n=1 Tax=Steinernema glaseri TaxID=37863 RepID=A0A1I8ADY1_9BILA
MPLQSPGITSKHFHVSGSALTMDHRTVRIQFNDYNGGKTHFPVCVLKTSYGKTGPYEYIVLVEANTCKSASILVRDPETFFDKDNSELIHFLQHISFRFANKSFSRFQKVRENELEEMDVVPHDGTCSAE